MFSAQCKMVTSCSTIGTLKCPCNNVSGFRGLEIFDRVIQKITNGRFGTLPNYLPSKVVIPGSYFETQNFSGTSEQRTNTCNDIQTRRCAVAEKARALRSESGSGSETGCVSVSRSDPDSDPNWDPNSHFDFNQDLAKCGPGLRPGLLPRLPFKLGSGQGLRPGLKSALQPALLLVQRYLAFSSDFLLSGILALKI